VTRLLQFFSDESGATSIEYAVMSSCVALAIIAAVSGLGSKVLAQYTSVATALN